MIITGKKFSKPAMSRVINGDTILKNTDEKPEKTRLDRILLEKYPEYNRSTLQKFIKNGFVTVDAAPALKPNLLLAGGEEILLNLPPELADKGAKKTQIERAHPEIIYEDENVLVLNKPAGLLSMAKGELCAEPTLEDYGLLVHRLDRDTSGVVILAKNPETQSMLRRQFQDRKTYKTYYAIIQGRPKTDEALIDLPIARNLKHPNTFLVAAGGKESQTYYKVLRTSAEHSLLELKPVTGRTHQLRVHLNYLGHPILGDKVYGGGEAPRLFLHAGSLEITIPGSPTNERMIFTAPLPKEFTDVL